MSTRRKTSHVLACLLLGMVSLGAVVAALLAGDVAAAGAVGAGLMTLVVTTATIYTLGPDDEQRPRPEGRGRAIGRGAVTLPEGLHQDARYGGAPQTDAGALRLDVALILQDAVGVHPDKPGESYIDDEDALYLAGLVIARVLRQPVEVTAPTLTPHSPG